MIILQMAKMRIGPSTVLSLSSSAPTPWTHPRYPSFSTAIPIQGGVCRVESALHGRCPEIVNGGTETLLLGKPCARANNVANRAPRVDWARREPHLPRHNMTWGDTSPPWTSRSLSSWPDCNFESHRNRPAIPQARPTSNWCGRTQKALLLTWVSKSGHCCWGSWENEQN